MFCIALIVSSNLNVWMWEVLVQKQIHQIVIFALKRANVTCGINLFWFSYLWQQVKGRRSVSPFNTQCLEREAKSGGRSIFKPHSIYLPFYTYASITMKISAHKFWDIACWLAELNIAIWLTRTERWKSKQLIPPNGNRTNKPCIYTQTLQRPQFSYIWVNLIQ